MPPPTTTAPATRLRPRTSVKPPPRSRGVHRDLQRQGKTLRLRALAATVICAVTIGAAVLAGVATLSGFGVVVDRTDSLTPAIRAGDLVVTRKVPAASVRRGDAVTFPMDRARPRDLIIQRVVAVRRVQRNLLFQTRGYANHLSEFRSVSTTERIAKVHAHVPYLGRMLSWLSTAPVAVALMFGVGILVAGAALRHIRS